MKQGPDHHVSRRRFLSCCGQAALVGLAPAPLWAAANPQRPSTNSLSLLNIHTGERLACTYREGGRLRPDALAAIDRILRDYRTGAVKPIDPQLLDLLAAVARRLGTDNPFQIVSGYRSPETNALLRRQGHGVARHSYHLLGRAVDVKVPGITTRELHTAALGERGGGVGYYPRSGFVHLDTGPVRTW